MKKSTMKKGMTAIVVRGGGEVVRVILVPDTEVPDDLDDLAEHGGQTVTTVEPDNCANAAAVKDIFDEMNPSDDDEPREDD